VLNPPPNEPIPVRDADTMTALPMFPLLRCQHSKKFNDAQPQRSTNFSALHIGPIGKIVFRAIAVLASAQYGSAKTLL